MVETILQLDILCHQVKPPVPGNELHLLSGPKGLPGSPQTYQAVVKAIKRTLKYATKHREVELKPLLTSIHGIAKYSACYQRKKVIINIAQLQSL